MASAAHINVAVRVRPLSERETTSAPATSAMGWRVGQKSLTQVDATSGAAIAAQTYAFGTHSELRGVGRRGWIREHV